MVMNFDDTELFYDNSLLNQIASELEKEKKDIEELSEVLNQLVELFQGASKSEIANPVRLKVRLRDLNANYRKIFFILISISIGDPKNGFFVTLDYDKIYYFANPDQIKKLHKSYSNILKSRAATEGFTEKEFKNFITKCSNIVNEIVSTIIIRPNTDFFIKKVNIMGVEEVT
jgi:hypothetical protein